MNENFKEYIKYIAYELAEFVTAKKGHRKELKIRISEDFKKYLEDNYEFNDHHFKTSEAFVKHARLKLYFSHITQIGENELNLVEFKFSKHKVVSIQKQKRVLNLKRPEYLQFRLSRFEHLNEDSFEELKNYATSLREGLRTHLQQKEHQHQQEKQLQTHDNDYNDQLNYANNLI